MSFSEIPSIFGCVQKTPRKFKNIFQVKVCKIADIQVPLWSHFFNLKICGYFVTNNFLHKRFVVPLSRILASYYIEENKKLVLRGSNLQLCILGVQRMYIRANKIYVLMILMQKVILTLTLLVQMVI